MRLKLFLCVLLTALSVKAVPVVEGDSQLVASADSAKVARKHPWLAGLEIVGFNGALHGFNRFILKDKDWMHVTLNSIERNISQNYWVWDCDGIEVNSFRHPLHGSIFYLISRANGMNMLESSLYSLGGSWMWEIFCESERPSINDMVYTSVGGATIGEVAWRTGKSWLGLVSKRHSHLRPTVPFSTSITLGYRHLKSHGHQAVNTAIAALDVSYGELFDGEHKGPFDYFEANSTLTIGQKQRFINSAMVDHQIVNSSILDKPIIKIVWGLYNHFDYYHVSPIRQLDDNGLLPLSLSYSEVGAIGPGIAYRVGQFINWEQQLYLNAIMMGATSTHVYHVVGSHDYNFGSGYGARLYSKLAVGNWLRIGVRAQFSHLFTWAGFYDDDQNRTRHSVASIQGETGNAVTTILEPSLELKPIKNLSLVCSGRYMNTHNNYTYHPHGSVSAWEWQVGLRYGIEL